MLVIAGGVLLFTNRPNTAKSVKINQPQQTTAQTGSGTPTVIPNMTTVEVTTQGYSPKTITLKAGARVIWINKTDNAVTVNSADHPTHTVYPPLNLGEFPKGSSVQLVFDKPGTYTYHNHFNPSQTGTVIVK